MIDPPRKDTAKTISSLQEAHISIKMITGDHRKIAKETSKLIGLIGEKDDDDDIIRTGEEIREQNALSNFDIKNDMMLSTKVFAEVLPSDKREVIVNLKYENDIIVGMVSSWDNDMVDRRSISCVVEIFLLHITHSSHFLFIYVVILFRLEMV